MNINSILGKKNKVTLDGLLRDGVIVTGNDMLDYVNTYFVSIADNLTNHFIYNEPYVHITASNVNSCNLAPTNVREVLAVIESLKNTGSGTFDLSIRCLKNNSHIFCVHLVFLYNYSIEKATFPSLLKTACVVPAYKSGLKDQIDNYRPISNLPVLSKVFEKLTLNRYSSFIENNNLLSNSQYGFRKGRNITQAAIKLVGCITDAFHHRKYSACFFLDLRKAFDTLDHDILLMKLFHMGFRGPANQYISSFLINRKQYVQIGNMKSGEKVIRKGVPQGSILGPLLFCLYINDIVASVKTEVVLFADDAAFFICADSLPQLQLLISNLFRDLSSYLKSNKLLPNLKRVNLCIFYLDHLCCCQI